MVQVVAPVVAHVAPPGDAVAVYPVRVPPSRLAGAVQDTVAVVSPGTAVTPVGACGPASTGTLLWVVLSSPSSPSALSPQQ